MTPAELHKILDDENKKISLEEYQEVLFQLKYDTIAFSTREEFDKQEQTAKFYWYNGETNAFQIALDLSKHINQNQKAIECLKDIKEELRRLDKVYKPKPTSDLISVLYKLDNYCDTKIKELEGEKE